MATWTSISETPKRLLNRQRARSLRAGLIPLVALSVDLPAHAADDQGAQLVAVCAACHRLDGQGGASIAGRPINDLKSAMWVFRSDDRSNAIMHAVSLSFSDDEVAMIAERLAHMGPQPRP